MKVINFKFFNFLILLILLISCKQKKGDSNNELSNHQTDKMVVDEKQTKLDSIKADRKNYKSITIGTQEWMSEDLKVEVFLNGDSIFQAKSNKEWQLAFNNRQPAWCYVVNDKNEFDKLYNIYVLKDKRRVVPEGWKIPSSFDWKILANSITKNEDLGCERCWVKLPNSIESLGFNNKNNGFRFKYGGFYSNDKHCFYWTSSYSVATTAIKDELLFKYGSIIRLSEESGFQIRCIRE